MDTTPVTTTKSERRRRRGRLDGWVVAIGALLGGLALLVLSLPRLGATVLETTQAGVIAALERDEPLPEETLRSGIDRLTTALGWHPSRGAHFDLALLYQSLAERLEPASPEHRKALRSAERSLRAGLALGPMEPLGWTRLGWLLARQGHNREALEAVRRSTLFATIDPREQWLRLELWLYLFREADPSDQPAVRRQLTIAYDHDPDRLVALATRFRVLTRVRQALAGAGVKAGELDLRFPIPLRLPSRTTG